MSTRSAPFPLLVVEDDDLTRAFLLEHLTADGYDPTPAASLAEATAHLATASPALVLSDVTLPDGSGLELVERIRAADGIVSQVDPATPVLLLTGRDGELDRVRGFERGCDDYLVKPFSYAELRLRIAGLLRRVDRRPSAGVLRIGALVVDPARRRVTVRGTTVALTQKEYALLLALVREPLRVFTKDELLRTVWGFRSAGVTRTIDSHACRLRRKLAVHGDEFVVNVWGVGYRLVDAAPEAAVIREGVMTA
ncbi:response regulator transcription factor [Patulibacter sp. SYSU D01012]|uniref:response regulator transcription factor n=1 Tax=Patulibacter sp. SYSU D01012 TaxID=2817381 RepID=UPI001B30379C|nr:response regulator transcription factor [Patulibacter sp. SYSU D01012]